MHANYRLRCTHWEVSLEKSIIEYQLNLTFYNTPSANWCQISHNLEHRYLWSIRQLLTTDCLHIKSSSRARVSLPCQLPITIFLHIIYHKASNCCICCVKLTRAKTYTCTMQDSYNIFNQIPLV